MKNRPIIIFYLLVIYVFASFLWWSYLLLKKNSDAFTDKVMFEKLKYDRSQQISEASRDYFVSDDYLRLKSSYKRQKIMIVSEGLVFLTLLAIGSIRLWQTFNKEISLARQQNNFLLSITHELKSPLASMKLSLQTILKRSQLEDKYRRLIENSVEDVDRLSNLVDNILYAARMEDTTLALKTEMENISTMVRNVLEKIQMVHKDSVKLKTNIEENILLETDKLAFASVVNNLVENAIKYSNGDGEIEVLLSKSDKTITLEVKDHGIGIPANERANIFKKFYRIGNEETRNTKGTGLGLFIVKRVVDLHHGKIFVTENKPKGTVVRVTIPA